MQAISFGFQLGKVVGIEQRNDLLCDLLGDGLIDFFTLRLLTGFSERVYPRGRGNRNRNNRQQEVSRSIPAWAGQPAPYLSPDLRKRVYPRVGGATIIREHQEYGIKGLSPRGRGNLSANGIKSDYTGSIPAWAGQPLT